MTQIQLDIVICVASSQLKKLIYLNLYTKRTNLNKSMYIFKFIIKFLPYCETIKYLSISKEANQCIKNHQKNSIYNTKILYFQNYQKTFLYFNTQLSKKLIKYHIQNIISTIEQLNKNNNQIKLYSNVYLKTRLSHLNFYRKINFYWNYPMIMHSFNQLESNIDLQPIVFLDHNENILNLNNSKDIKNHFLSIQYISFANKKEKKDISPFIIDLHNHCIQKQMILLNHLFEYFILEMLSWFSYKDNVLSLKVNELNIEKNNYKMYHTYCHGKNRFGLRCKNKINSDNSKYLSKYYCYWHKEQKKSLLTPSFL